MACVGRQGKAIQRRHQEPSYPAQQGSGQLVDQLSVSLAFMDGRRQTMRTPDEVATMLRLHGLGRGTRKIELGLVVSLRTLERSVSHLRQELVGLLSE